MLAYSCSTLSKHKYFKLSACRDFVGALAPSKEPCWQPRWRKNFSERQKTQKERSKIHDIKGARNHFPGGLFPGPEDFKHISAATCAPTRSRNGKGLRKGVKDPRH
jgi:hypothetical protein